MCCAWGIKKKKKESDYGFPFLRKHPEEGTLVNKKELQCTVLSSKWSPYRRYNNNIEEG